VTNPAGPVADAEIEPEAGARPRATDPPESLADKRDQEPRKSIKRR